MKDIAIVYICTGKYDVFWKDFYLSFEDKFIPTMSKDYYVFTDSDSIFGAENENVHVIYQENLGWPGNTLYRFQIFLSQKEALKEYEFIFFMNANVICVDDVDESFLPKGEGLLFVQHPYHYKEIRLKHTYERNRKSKAYMPIWAGKYYVCGGVNGGRSKDFLRMCEELKKRIDEDDKNGIVAIWHDESHINRYCYEQKRSKILSPSYCYPEDVDLPFKPILMVREKSKWIDVEKVKANEE